MHKYHKISIEAIVVFWMHTWLWSWLISFISCTLETNAKYCQNFVKFMMFDFFVYVLGNYEK